MGYPDRGRYHHGAKTRITSSQRGRNQWGWKWRRRAANTALDNHERPNRKEGCDRQSAPKDNTREAWQGPGSVPSSRAPNLARKPARAPKPEVLRGAGSFLRAPNLARKPARAPKPEVLRGAGSFLRAPNLARKPARAPKREVLRGAGSFLRAITTNGRTGKRAATVKVPLTIT